MGADDVISQGVVIEGDQGHPVPGEVGAVPGVMNRGEDRLPASQICPRLLLRDHRLLLPGAGRRFPPICQLTSRSSSV